MHKLRGLFRRKSLTRSIKEVTHWHPVNPSQPSLPMARLPVELEVLCLSFMTVECLIFSSLVCSRWRGLARIADVHPTRRRLFNLYRLMMDRPKPDKLARRYLRQHLDHAFDREAYIHALERQNPVYGLPEEFRMWVLEWPAKLCINGIWPGLPYTNCFMNTNATAGESRKYGVNYVARRPPLVSHLPKQAEVGGESAEDVAMLLIWSSWWWENVFVRGKDIPPVSVS